MFRALNSLGELHECRRQLCARGVDFTDHRRLRLWALAYLLRYGRRMPSPDPLKSWDVSHALAAIEQAGLGPSAPVLDMGCFNSEILYVLHTLGYKELYGCDLNPMCRLLPYWHRVHYKQADLTRTPYPSRFFAGITCLSVIEHGVPVQHFVPEVARLLRPGGILVLTTDYDASGDPHAVSTDVKPFGLDWRVYSPEALKEMLDHFENAGLTLSEPAAVDWRHEERPISWNGHNYTFALMVLRKQT